MKSILAVLAALFILALPTNATTSRPKVAESVRPLQMLVKTEDGKSAWHNTCTITSISEEAHLWLTAGHCVSNEEMTKVLSANFAIDGKPALPYKVSFDKDIAILYTPDFSVSALKLARVDPTYGDDVTIWGHPFGFDDIVFVKGYLASPDHSEGTQHFTLFAVPIAPGNSGSAVLNKNNEIISIVQNSWSYLPAFEPIGGGVPYHVLRQFLVGVLG